ncbi:MAG: response regulator [Cyclobacteriaceae bacterium]
MAISILFVDDHDLFREGIISLMHDQPFKFIAQLKEGSQVLTKLKAVKPDILLLDLELPDMNGIEIAREVLSQYPEMNILVLSGNYNSHYITEAIQIGVKGFIVKNADKQNLINAISTVSNGNSYYSSEIISKISKSITMSHNENGFTAMQKLSQREKEILGLIAEGYKNHEIADRLFISTHTVITHRRNLLQKSGTHNTAGLVMYAAKIGLT